MSKTVRVEILERTIVSILKADKPSNKEFYHKASAKSIVALYSKGGDLKPLITQLHYSSKAADTIQSMVDRIDGVTGVTGSTEEKKRDKSAIAFGLGFVIGSNINN